MIKAMFGRRKLRKCFNILRRNKAKYFDVLDNEISKFHSSTKCEIDANLFNASNTVTDNKIKSSGPV